MKIFLSLIFAITCVGVVKSQSEHKWQVGVSYMKYNFNMSNKYDDSYWAYRNMGKRNLLGNYLGIDLSRKIKGNIYLHAGVGYSIQSYINRTAEESLRNLKLFSTENILRLEYLHIPIIIEYQHSLSYQEDFGIMVGLGVLNSYNTDIYNKNISYDRVIDGISNGEPATGYVEYDRVTLVNTLHNNYHHAVSYYYDGSIFLERYNEVDFKEFRLYQFGGLASVKVYKKFYDQLKLSLGVMYNYDFTRAESKGYQRRWTHGLYREPGGYDPGYSHIIRWGFSFDVKYLF